MAEIDLTQFDGHTAGPWRWEFNGKNRHVGLCGGVPAYDLTVMDFTRWGMGGAQPVFLEPGNLPTLHRLSDRQDWVAPIPSRERHAHWCSTVTHPDARLMAAAPDLLAEVKLQAAEIERLKADLSRERSAHEETRLARNRARLEGIAEARANLMPEIERMQQEECGSKAAYEALSEQKAELDKAMLYLKRNLDYAYDLINKHNLMGAEK